MPLNVDELVAVIPGDNPAGESLPYTVRAELEDARKSIDPADFDPKDPARPTEAKLANWPKIVTLASKTLKETSKHLELAARLTEAQARVEGFGGLADGLTLLRSMVEKCWDRMYPAIEDGDVEVRAGPFDWLGEVDRGSRFPHTIRSLAVVTHNGKGFSLLDWRKAQDGKTGKDAIDKAVAAAPREACQSMFDAVTRCQEQFLALSKLLGEKMGPVSPAMTDFRAALGEAFTLTKQILDQKGPIVTAAAEGAATEAPGSAPAAGAAAGTAAPRAVATRADVYRQLHETANLLEKMEPHSPIPYLIRRAVELGAMPFPQLMKALIRNDGILTEMNRELGIKGEDPPAKPADKK